MSTPKKSDICCYSAPIRTGLSPEEIQEVVKQMYTWLDRLTAEGKAKAGKPLFPEGKVVSTKERSFRLGRPICRIERSDRWVFLARGG